MKPRDPCRSLPRATTRGRDDKLISTLFQASPALRMFFANRPDEEELIKKAVAGDPKRLIESFKKDLFDSISKKSLRIFKYRVLSILAAKSLINEISITEFFEHWSKAADTCIEAARRFCFEDICAKYGRPKMADGQPFTYCVIALGKLGSEELNLSSDIDLLFLYNSDNGIVGDGDISINDFASRLSVSIASALSERTEDGFCFRVDNGLRPEGNKGAIANSIDAAVRFYETWGLEIERMMLIRARPAAGDLILGTEFVSRVRPFIYRKNMDIAALSKIRELKEKIRCESVKKGDDAYDVKLGDGGIREAEFVIQSMQLLHGGKNSNLITNKTMKALDEVNKAGYLPKKQCKELKNAYLFLRSVENMIQLPFEKQSHKLPSAKEDIDGLARLLRYAEKGGIPASDALMSDIEKQTSVIKYHFQHMFERDPERFEMEDSIFSNISGSREGEEEVDSLAWFKKEETKRIQFQDMEKNMPVETVSEKLSLVAEVIISEAFKIAANSMRGIYGAPLVVGNNSKTSPITVVGMGKLGGKEIDYASDLDLIFIYADDGETSGPKKITNQEYFTRLTQRIISLITMPTRYGRAYQIDADLRPSGRAGVLVTTLEAFKNYHHIEAMLWERQSLIKARPIAGDPFFSDTVARLIGELCYDRKLPAVYKNEVKALRSRMENEKAAETESRFNVKLGAGGLMDVETICQYLQLLHAKDDSGLRDGNTLSTLNKLAIKGFLNKDISKRLIDGYLFYKRILSRIRLYSNHATDFLDTKMPELEQISKGLGYADKNELLAEFQKNRNIVRKIYIEIMNADAGSPPSRG